MENGAEPVLAWLAEAGAGDQAPIAGAAGQRRLLGHRNQARAGRRITGLPALHPQGLNRCQLSCLRRYLLARRDGSIRNSPPTMPIPRRCLGDGRQ